MDRKRIIIFSFMALAFIGVWNGLAGIVDATNSPILNRFNTISTIAFSIPSNNNADPYGVVRVNHSAGSLKEGHILVSNFNRGAELPTDTAIMDVAPDGSMTVFSKITPDLLTESCPGGAGSITGLVVLRDWVIVSALPGSDSARVAKKGGCLIVLDNAGRPVETFSGSLINSPGDLAASESDQEAKLFVRDVITRPLEADGTSIEQGTVVRINLSLSRNDIPRIESMTVIASGFPVPNDTALRRGASGLGLSPRCINSEDGNCTDCAEKTEQILYVADGLNDRIAFIPSPLSRTTSAGTGLTLSSKGSLNAPVNLLVAPNGHILTANANDGFITEITPQGTQVATVPAAQFRQAAWHQHAPAEPTLSMLR